MIRSQNFIIFGAREQFCPPTSKLWPSGTELDIYITSIIHINHAGSAFGLAKASVTSPQKLRIFSLQSKMYGSKASQNDFI